MKLIRLFLIALLVQPCPVCWGHGFAADESCENVESGNPVSTRSCCSQCHQWRLTQEKQTAQNHDEHHDCPCFCHVSEIIFAQTIPVVNLRGIALTDSVVVDLCCLAAQTAVSQNSNAAAAAGLPITVPLRI